MILSEAFQKKRFGGGKLRTIISTGCGCSLKVVEKNPMNR